MHGSQLPIFPSIYFFTLILALFCINTDFNMDPKINITMYGVLVLIHWINSYSNPVNFRNNNNVDIFNCKNERARAVTPGGGAAEKSNTG